MKYLLFADGLLAIANTHKMKYPTGYFNTFLIVFSMP